MGCRYDASDNSLSRRSQDAIWFHLAPVWSTILRLLSQRTHPVLSHAADPAGQPAAIPVWFTNLRSREFSAVA